MVSEVPTYDALGLDCLICMLPEADFPYLGP